MMRIALALLLVFPVRTVCSQAVAVAGTPATAPPAVFALRAEALLAARGRLRARDAELEPAFKALIHAADKALAAPLVAVTDKHTLLPPSGDKHDYYSLSPYWWPDPSKPDGLPYMRRDGVTNPESKRDLDQPRVATLGGNVQALALAYFFTGDEKYATRAATQVRTWFLDPATRMNPNLRFAQLVRGNAAERGSGIIDTRHFIEVVDAIGLLRGSPSWTATDDRGMRRWLTSYLDWLLTSPNGKHEHAAKNNHGSWFAAQTASYALFVNDTARARQIATDAKARIGWQITPEGQQPIEMERTRSMHYSGFNIEALSRLAEMGRHVDVDLWHYQAPEGGSLPKAVRYLAYYVGSSEKWPGPQIDAVSPDLILIDIRRAQFALNDPTFEQALQRLPRNVVATDRSAILYPDPPRR